MTDAERDDLRERLFGAPCRVVDFLPRQVPPSRGGEYFAAERYLTQRAQLDELYARFARFAVKLGCYCRFAVSDPASDGWTDGPAPEELARRIAESASGGTVHVLAGDERALLTLDGGDLYLSLYGGEGEFLETARLLAAAEGLFLRPSGAEIPLGRDRREAD